MKIRIRRSTIVIILLACNNNGNSTSSNCNNNNRSNKYNKNKSSNNSIITNLTNDRYSLQSQAVLRNHNGSSKNKLNITNHNSCCRIYMLYPKSML